MPVNEKRLQGIKALIESGHITRFGQIFDHIPKTIVKEALGTNNDRITRLISNIREFSLEEILIISNLLHTDFEKILAICCTQILNENVGRSKKKKVIV